MITVIGRHPNRENERDGMVQRIAAIDKILEKKERQYLEISFWRYWKKQICIENGITVYKVNFLLYFVLLYKLLKKSDYIYVHSIYNAFKIFPFFYIFKNIITDLHGVVPAELALCNEKLKARRYSWIEYQVMSHSFKIIAVTETMKNFYIKKYPFTAHKFLYISIFANKQIRYDSPRKRNGVIYAGGTQRWQCVDKMIELIGETKDKYDWTILTGNPAYFSAIKSNNVLITSVKPKDVEKYYNSNTFGIILREDSIVNKVACPTKLIEYIQTGLIPVVYSPYIGDFYKYGYRYVTYENFKNGKLPSEEEIGRIRIHNHKILEGIMAQTKQNINQLKDIVAC